MMNEGLPNQAQMRGEGVSPPQMELPSPKNEAESKPPAEPAVVPNETKPQVPADQVPGNPFEATPGNKPLEPAPQRPPETTMPGGEPGTAPTEPNMEMPGTEPPKEPSSAPSDNSQPAPNEAPALSPSDSNESKPQEPSMPEPDSGQQRSGAGPGAMNMSPDLKLRRCAATGRGGREQDADPAPIMPVVRHASAAEAAPNAFCAKAGAQEPIPASTAKAAPALIAPSLQAQHLAAPKAESRNPQSPGDNPLRADGVVPSAFLTGDSAKPEAVQPVNRDSSTLFSGTNPLR